MCLKGEPKRPHSRSLSEHVEHVMRMIPYLKPGDWGWAEDTGNGENYVAS